VHAIVLTLVRLTATQRRLLEWETAAAVAERGPKRAGVRAFVVEMRFASPLLALLGLALGGRRASGRSPAAVPVLVLWAAAPHIAHALSRPVAQRRLELGPEDRAFLGRVARDTWRYFEAFNGPEDHGLPPDNFQEMPEPTVFSSDLTHEHRDGAARHAGRPRSRLHRHGRLGGEGRRHAHDDGGLGAVEGHLLNLVRHAEPGSPTAALRLDRGQRKTSRPRS